MIKTLKILLATTLVLAASASQAGSFEPFSQERLDALNAEGTPVLVEVYADWCSTCKRQSPILSRLLTQDEFADVVALKLDWDDQRSEAQALGAPRQSTLFVFRDGERVDMSVAETNEARLHAFLSQAVN